MNTSYIAGIVDGEGYIGAYPAPESLNKYGRTLIPCVKIAQAGVFARDNLLLPLKEKYGGYISTRRFTNKNWTQAYMWELKSAKSIKLFIDDIYPHLILKKKQAELILTICDLTRKDKREDRITRKWEAYQALRFLTKRGAADND
jgi:hypothetical protein